MEHWFQLQAYGIPAALADQIKIKFDGETRQVSLKIPNVTVFEEPAYQSISQFFIHATSSGSSSAQAQLEGLIPVTIASGARCKNLLEETTKNDVISPSYEKDQVRLSFIISRVSR